MATNQKVKIDLEFNADTTAAKKQILDLQKSLEDVTKIQGSTSQLAINKDLHEASKTAVELQHHIQKAVNVNTGKLDLSRFASSLKASKASIDQYRDSLLKIGPQGQQAFDNLAKAIANAETPTLRLNKIFSDMATSLKNTIKWQISSNVVHGFSSALNKAFGYAQDLDKSLTNIRIVTGQSSEQMAKFAKEANNAAKALNTDTLAYTDAALIYYQQGLNDEEVKARTDATIKMANVTGENAQEVSSYMTAIWNNFSEGSDNLEHFADVITALGASTASSSEEIAEGLEKFAAIGRTVGLSYEYATSALATVVAQTRQSADTVGTAFKTIFGRLQGLSLGETLEDGTNLNKYSKALYSVGINIKDVNGDIKNMDTILDELGKKWITLGKDQQIALAQTVGGTRQYQQLIALMDNWSAFQENLSTARMSDGTLSEQAEIYAESWRAARKEVQAAMEGIYDSIINDKFFIGFNKGLAEVLKGVNSFIDSIGGVGGIISSVGAILLNVYATKMPDALTKLKENFYVIFNQAQKMTQNVQDQFIGFYSDIADKNKGTARGDEANQIINREKVQKYLLQNENKLTELEKEQIKNRLKLYDAASEDLKIQRLKLETLEKQTQELKNQQENTVVKKVTESKNKYEKSKQELANIDQEIKKIIPNDRGEYNQNESFRLAALHQQRVQTETEYRRNKEEYRNYSSIYSDNFDSQAIRNSFRKKNNAFVEALQAWNNAFGTETKLETQQSIYNIDNTGDIKQKQFDAAKELNKYLQSDELLKNNINQISGASEEENKKLEQLKKIINGDKSAVFNSAEEFNKALELLFKKLTEKVQEIEKDTGKKVEEARHEVREAGGDVDIINDTAQNIENRTAQAGLVEGSVVNVANTEGIPHEIGSNGDLSQKRLLRGSQTATQLASSLMSLNSALTSVTSVMNLFNGETHSANEVISTLIGAISTLTFTYIGYNKVLNSTKLGTSVLNTLTKAIFAIKIKDVTATGAQATAEQIATNTKWASAAASAALNAALLLGIVAISGIVAAINAHNKSLEKQVENAKEAADQQKEQVEQQKQEVESIRALADEYNKLIKEQEQQNKNITELRQNAFDLCLQYGEEELAVKALTASYEELRNVANDALIQKNKSLIEEQKYNQDKLEDILRTSQHKQANKGILFADYDSIFTSRQGVFAQDIYKNILNVGQSDLEDNRIDLLDYKDALIENYDEIQRYMTAMADTSVAKTSDYKAFKKFWDENRDTIKEAKIGLEEINKIQKENILLQNQNNVNDQTSYLDTVSKMAEEAISQGVFKGDDAEKEAYEWAISALKGVANASNDFSKQGILFTNLIEKGIPEDDVKKYIKDLTEGQISFLIQTDALYEELDSIKEINDFLKENQKLAENFNIGTTRDIAYNIISSTNKEMTKDEIDQLYNTGFDEVSREIFEAMDTDEQYLHVIDYMLRQNELLFDQKEIQKEINQLEHERTQYVVDNAKELENNKNIVSSFEESLEGALDANADAGGNLFNYSREEYLKAIQTGDTDSLVYKDLINSGIINDTDIEQYAKASSALEKYNNTIEAYNSAISNASKPMDDFQAALNRVNENITTNNKNIDTIQSSYKTLKSAIEEYNKNNRISLDTLQSLLNLDFEYLSSLEFQNGQLVLNAHNTKVLLNAEIEKAKLNAWENYQLQVQNILTEDAVIKTNQLATSQVNQAAAQKIANGDMAEAIELLRQYNAEAVLASGKDISAETQKRLDDAAQGYANILEMFNNFEIDDKSISGFSSSSNKKNKKEEDKYYKDEFDRYYEIKKAIETVDRALNKLDKQKKKLFGKDLHDALQKENDLLQEQAANYKALQKAQLEDRTILQGMMKEIGVSFDEQSGNISNYAKATEKAFQTYNDAILAYNASAQGTADKTALENAEKTYNHFKDLISKYDSLQSEINDTEDKLENATDKMYDIFLENFTMQIEINLDVSNIKREWIDFQKTMADLREDDFLGEGQYNLKKLNTYFMDGGDLQEYTRMINETLNSQKISEADRQKLLKEYLSGLEDALSAIKEIEKEIRHAYLDLIDDVTNKFEEHVSQYDHINNLLEHQSNLITLLYGDKAFSKQADFYEATRHANMGQINFLKSELDYWKNLVSQFKEGTDEWKAAQEQLQATQESLNELVEQSIQNITDKYKNAVSDILQSSQYALTGGLSLDSVQFDYDMKTKLQEATLDPVTQLLEAQKLANKITKTMNNNTNLAYQEKLQHLLDNQVEALKTSDEIRQYDVDRANELYEITLKQMALDDARANKDTLRLVRDTQGNWVYQYTANMDALSDANDSLLEEQGKLYELDTNALKEYTSQYVSIIKEMYAEIERIANDNTLTLEDKELQKQNVMATYQGLLNNVTTALQEIQPNITASGTGLLGLIMKDDESILDVFSPEQKLMIQQMLTGLGEDYVAFEEGIVSNWITMKDSIGLVMGDINELWNTTILDMANKFYYNDDSFANVISALWEQIDLEQIIWNEQVETISELAGENFMYIAGNISAVDGMTQGLILTNAVLMESIYNETQETMDLVAELDQLLNRYEGITTAAYNAANAANAFVTANQNIPALVDNVKTKIYELANSYRTLAQVMDAVGGTNITEKVDDILYEKEKVTSIYGGPHNGDVVKWKGINAGSATEYRFVDTPRNYDFVAATNKNKASNYDSSIKNNTKYPNQDDSALKRYYNKLVTRRELAYDYIDSLDLTVNGYARYADALGVKLTGKMATWDKQLSDSLAKNLIVKNTTNNPYTVTNNNNNVVINGIEITDPDTKNFLINLATQITNE